MRLLPSVGVMQPQLGAWPGLARCRLLTGVGGPVGERQIGPCSPRPGAKVLLALAAVLPRGVVLALALQAALLEGAQVSMEVAFTPARQEKSCQVLLVLLLAPALVPSTCRKIWL